MKRILTGIQPSGIPHIGNYFGAMKQCIDLQNENAGECFLFIADYHWKNRWRARCTRFTSDVSCAPSAI